MSTRGQEIVSLIKRQIEEFGGELSLVDVGTVVRVGDGIASIQGLQGVRSNELLDFGNDVFGLALNLEADIVGAAIAAAPAQRQDLLEAIDVTRRLEIALALMDESLPVMEREVRAAMSRRYGDTSRLN